ncbi:MAG: hypothetical protein A2Z14_06920 [Chloroflexi bacterium RBG_16_48_8]|nr:MAG: hypothetical protein A2Z14_06920 [Chloroflexi bacterium RBG_16_48_8]
MPWLPIPRLITMAAFRPNRSTNGPAMKLAINPMAEFAVSNTVTVVSGTSSCWRMVIVRKGQSMLVQLWPINKPQKINRKWRGDPSMDFRSRSIIYASIAVEESWGHLFLSLRGSTQVE